MSPDETVPVYELLYPSGHRQIWRPLPEEGGSRRFFQCVTYCPDGRPVEFRVASVEQWKRTRKRVLRSGGAVKEVRSFSPQALEADSTDTPL